MKNIIWIMVIFLVSCTYMPGSIIDIDKTPERGFRSIRPAESWEESLVAGNGIMGALVMGYPFSDTITVSHSLLYMPIKEPLTPVNQGEHLDHIRSMMLEGDFGDASQFVVDLSHREGWGGKRWTDPIIPAFDLVIGMGHDTIEEYARTTNFLTGEAAVKWRTPEGVFERTTFVSRSENVIVTRIISDGSPVSGRFGLAPRHRESWWGGIDRREGTGIDEVIIATEENCITYRSSFQNRWDGLIEGYEGALKVTSRGGDIDYGQDEIIVKGADEIILLTRVEPSYDYNSSRTGEIIASLANINPDYENLLESHRHIHGELFSRSSLDIGGGSERKSLPVEELLGDNSGGVDPALVELQFDAARYNIISSTGINPPNLQGIWSGTLTPPWSGDFTLNGNVPVAVSSMLCANMPEMMLPLFDMLERHMDDFRLNAEKLYNAGGIHVPSRMSSHGLNNHFDAIWPMTFWTAGAGWYSMFYYDYYLHTGDMEFLTGRALPFMEEAVAFYEDFLITGQDGKYMFVPSYSPENNPGNIPYQACINATMDVMVARQLLRNIIEASELTGLNSDRAEKWQAMLDKMPAYDLNERGELREWIWPGMEENHSHRHVSQLYALFDIMDPEFRDKPELTEGARKVINEKMRYRREADGGIMSFGMVQLAFAAAMIGEADACYDMLGWLSRNFWFNNMVSTHDPGHIFNLDLSGGFPAVIVKMLAYSEPGLVKLFPALPEGLPEGKIEGVLLRGNIRVNKLEWDHTRVSIELQSGLDQGFLLDMPAIIDEIEYTGGRVSENGDPSSRWVEVEAGENVNMDIMLRSAVYE